MMNRPLCLKALYIRVLAGAVLLCSSTILPASTLIHNVKGYTINNGVLQTFGAMEFDNGKVIATYKKKPAVSDSTRLIDGQQKTLLPGLIDSHGHISSLGRALQTVDLVATRSEDDAISRIQLFLDRANDENTDQQWVTGRGWNQVLWPGGEFPDRTKLDAISNEIAFAFGRIDGHALWVNGKALQLAGIDINTADPEGGQIIRDARGIPTGVLVDNAMNLVFDAIPSASDAQTEQYIDAALRRLASLGLTSVHDAGASAQDIRAMRTLRSENALPIRVYAMLDVNDRGNASTLAQGIHLDPEQILDIRSIKISADGALGSRGAAMIQDYSDKPGHKGLSLQSTQQLQNHMAYAMAQGYQVNVHAIGDHANRRVLNMFEELQSSPLRLLQRHRIEHAQILNPADLKRFSALGVIASVQPTHASSDKNMAADRVGEERLDAAYAWRSLLQSGARVAGGSDFPVEPANPFFGLHAAVTRQDRNNEPAGGWLPDEKISLVQALAMFTESAAYAAHQENAVGSLLPGYWADFILIEDDIFDTKPELLWQQQVLQTFVAGKQVF
ncbi:MAG: amidohydrolase [Pseudomonadota bacterium]